MRLITLTTLNCKLMIFKCFLNYFYRITHSSIIHRIVYAYRITYYTIYILITYYIKFLFLKFIIIIILSIFSSHTVCKISTGSIQIPLSNLPINLIWTLDQFHTIEKFYIHKNLQESRKEKTSKMQKEMEKNI